MPIARLSIAEVRDKLRDPDIVGREAFSILQTLCALTADESVESELRELVLRFMEYRDELPAYRAVLDSLVRQVGLYPYLEQSRLSERDWLAYEVHKPDNMESGLVLHRSQASVYRRLLEGENIALSAPTSFGKSLLIDAALSTSKYSNVAIVVPTVALIDETRRRLTGRFGREYKVITHPSQSLAVKNIFVLTQERVMEFADFPPIDFFVVDEFYKLNPGSDDDERCAMLNNALYRLLKVSRQFYMLGPFILGLSQDFRVHFQCRFIKEDFHTVVSEIHRVPGAGDGDVEESQILVELCRTLDDSTIIFCGSPRRAAEIALALTNANFALDATIIEPAADWVAKHYHPDWHFAQALRNGIGIHHGRIPRALGQMVVRHFNNGDLRFLICTSTLIEGVNTRAKNIIILDNRINRANIDLFTFNNIRGRAGRMRQHFVGHVYIFHAPPQMGLPFVDPPAFSQNENAPDSLLIQLDDADLLPSSQSRIDPYKDQGDLPFETLRTNIGVDPAAQLELARSIAAMSRGQLRLLSWTGLPTYDELKFICELIWNAFDGRRRGAGAIRSASQLTLFLNRLRSAPTSASLIRQAISGQVTPDEAVQQINDFLRLWAQFHFPRLLRTTDSIQRSVLSKLGVRPGNYDFFAGRVESLFIDSALIILDEYGIPIELARKLAPHLERDGNLDATLEALKRFDSSSVEMEEFERELIRDAQSTL